MPANGTGKYQFFKIPTLFDKIIWTMTMAHTRDILLENWPFIQILSNIMCSGTNQLHPTLVCLMIGLGSGERR